MTVVTIIITTPLTLETLFSVATRSRQIEKRLFWKTTIGTSWKRLRFQLVVKVIPRNRRFSICRDLVVTEKRVSTAMSVAIMIVTTVIDIHIYVYIYRCICIYVYRHISSPRRLCGSSAALWLLSSL